VAVVTADGELDAFVERDLRAALDQVLDATRVLLDLTDVGFLDSTALGLVVRAVREVEEHGGSIRVVLPRGTARRIFEITTLDRVLPVAAHSTAARAELEAQ
jgi:anti-sigma B factor antagonist